jgi:nucleotide-binding universal stress UspA family protein
LGNPPEIYDPIQTTISPCVISAATADFRKLHEEILKKAAGKAAEEKPQVKVETELKEGDPAEVIVDTATTRGFDIIVLGHSGVGRLKEVLKLGGTSERVAHLARCPVLIVK